MAFLDKVKNLLAKNADKVDTAIDKAGDIVDKKTQGKYTQHVDKVQGAAKKVVRDADTGGQVPPTQQSGQVPPPQPPPGTPPQQQPPTAPPTS
ncbi:antitoxin [Mycobacterium deserti]|uniref:Antitoxin n=1 Tax=Mycobacterium deserti TaxID=2978347 RepID=A0ABT2M5J9_9MYCO|nr:antitoxin [Mycobacterium deserti]MCT7657527.1 antitoxin [Mycobacterium deserti]